MRAARDAGRRGARPADADAPAGGSSRADGAGRDDRACRRKTLGDAVLRHGPSLPALEALDAIHDRIESPADKLLRTIEPWSSFFVLPIFALANAGVILSLDVFASHERLMLAIILGLVVGKPLGIMIAAALAVRSGSR